MKTKIVNLRKEKYDVYIGRGSPFGNPFKIGRHGSREEVIERFRKYFYAKIEMDEIFAYEVLRLKGKVLGCYCKPLACHGDIIIEFLEE